MFLISTFEPFVEENLQDGSWLVLTHALRKPPHILVLAGGRKFELTVRGRETSDPLQYLLRRIQINKIPSVFFRLRLPEHLSDDLLASSLREKIDLSTKVEAGGDTCFTPVRAAFASLLDKNLQEAQFIYEFIPMLDAAGWLGEAMGWAMPENMPYQLPQYSAEELEISIRKASREISVN